MKVFARLLPYLRRYIAWIALAMVGVMVFSVVTTVLISLIEPVFGEVLMAEGDQVPGGLGKFLDDGDGDEAVEAKEATDAEIFVETGKRWLKRWIDESYVRLKKTAGIDQSNVVVFLPLLILVLYCIRAASDTISTYAFQRIGFGVTTDIRNDLYGRILDQSSRFFMEHSTGELLSRVLADVNLLQMAVSSRLLDLFRSGLTLLLLLILLLSNDLGMALACLVLAPVVIVPIVRFGKGMRRYSHRSQEKLADLAGLVTEGVRGHRVVKAFGMLDFENRKFRGATRQHLRVNLRAQVLVALSGPLIETLAVAGVGFLLYYAGSAIREGTMTPERLIGFLVNLVFMYEPLRRLNQVNLILQQSLAAAQRIFLIMDIPNEIVDPVNPRKLDGFSGAIHFDQVRFTYGREPVLHGIDLEVRRGEAVAIVGKSGAGKSTLVNLLPRFFDVSEGRVTIDGVDVRELSLDHLRSLIGVVTQDTILFDDTVRNNIAYGRSDLPLEMVQEAAKAAYAHDFVSKLPEGYETSVGEGGLEMSGGQRQRLAIARAILKDAPILILDEATSHLDSHAESLVQRALANLLEGRTTLIIAHRLATVMRADRIIVLDQGKVIEEGNHEQLLERGGVYRELYDLQFQL